MPKPSDLLQGTLDLLILQTIARHLSTGGVLLSAFKACRETSCRWGKGLCHRLSTVSTTRAGLLRNGRIPISGDPPNFIL